MPRIFATRPLRVWFLSPLFCFCMMSSIRPVEHLVHLLQEAGELEKEPPAL